jgi:hypothetical protein
VRLRVIHRLADFAVFREYISEKLALPKTTKWVAFGGSYSGALSAWFRLKVRQQAATAISWSNLIQWFWRVVLSTVVVPPPR